MSEESLPIARPAPGQSAGPESDTDAELPSPWRATPATIAAVAGAVLFCATAGSFRRLTAPAEAATFSTGAVVCWLALRSRCRRFPAPRRLDARGSLAWAVVLVVFGVWELYADLRGSTPAHPTLSILLGPVIAPPVNRAIGYVLWLAAGVWVVRR